MNNLNYNNSNSRVTKEQNDESLRNIPYKILKRMELPKKN